MGFKERLKEARLEKGYTQEQLAKLIGVAKSTFTGYERGNSEPNMLTIKKIIDVLEIDANYLWADDVNQENTFVASFTEQELIKKYRVLDDHGKDVTEYILNSEYTRCVKEDETEYNLTVPKPSYQCGLSAGTGQFVFDDVPFEMIDVPIQYDNIDFVIGVSGDSMEPTFFDSEKVMIQKRSTINLGDVGAFMVDGESFIKELGKDRLISHNKAYSDILFEDKTNITLIGKVVGKLP